MSTRTMKPAVRRSQVKKDRPKTGADAHPIAARAARQAKPVMFSVRLPQELIDQLDDHCHDNRLSKQQVVEAALRGYLPA